MKPRHRWAIELLMGYPETTVAEMLGIRINTLRQWMQQDSFREALRARERAQQSSLARIARQAALNAASMLVQSASDPAKPDAKLLLDILKVSGAFEAKTTDPGEALAEAINQARKIAEAEYV